jgi:hypothetical protein
MKSFFIVALIVTILQACRQENIFPLDKGGTAPLEVSDITATPLPGAARITYRLPDDRNLLYIKAQTEIRPGVVREIKASYYTNNFIIDGFGDTIRYVIRLYSVGRNNKESDAVTVTVTPQTPPIFSVFESVKESVTETFGGIKFNMRNPAEAEVRIHVNTVDSLGNTLPAETFYTSAAVDQFAVRGYDTLARIFSIYVQDRWGNTSGTCENVFKPMHEIKLDKNKFRSTPLDGDMNNEIQQGRVITRLWDEGLTDNTMFQTSPDIKPLPHTFTVDLGVKAYLSRILVHGRVSANNLYLYNAGAPKEWEIYGALTPNADARFDESWIPLRTAPCVSFKPSGLPLGESNEDDRQRATNGEEFEFDANDRPVRYIRFSVNAVWGGNYKFFNMTEITLFGSIVETYH